jgi:hypothetical protein
MTTNSANRNVVILTTGIAITCLCLCVLFIGGVFAFRKEVVKAVPALEPVLSAGKSTATTAPKPVDRTVVVVTKPLAPTEGSNLAQATPTRLPTANLPSAWAKSMDEIQQQVIDLRGLQPSGEFFRDVLTSNELRDKTISDFNKDNTPTDIRNEVIELSSLGLLQPGFDLGNFYIDLLSEQIAGQYDPKTKEMYVVGDQFGGFERLTYSHEYVHALQDQNYDILNGLKVDTEPCKQDSERCAAVHALLEGDATLTQMDWFTQYASAQDYADVMNFYSNYKSPVYDSAPDYMKDDFLFPYDAGQKFVEYLYNQGGWGAVDAAYADVPVSTEQIMHPERYPDDKPIIVPLSTLTDTLGEGWQEVDHGVMGEWDTYLILAKGQDSSYRLDDNTAKKAAEGWGGDAYEAYYNEQSDETVMVISYQWDTPNDTDEFASALIHYGTLRFGHPASSDAIQTIWDYQNGYSIFRQTGQGTVWVIAPNQAIAQAVLTDITP